MGTAEMMPIDSDHGAWGHRVPRRPAGEHPQRAQAGGIAPQCDGTLARDVGDKLGGDTSPTLEVDMAVTQIDLDDQALAEVMRIAGVHTKKEAVNLAMRDFVERFRRIEALARSREQAKGWDYEGWLAARADEKAVGQRSRSTSRLRRLRTRRTPPA